MGDDQSVRYRVTVRYQRAGQLYQVLELEAEDLRAALRLAAERLPEEVLDTADLAEVRRANPAESV